MSGLIMKSYSSSESVPATPIGSQVMRTRRTWLLDSVTTDSGFLEQREPHPQASLDPERAAGQWASRGEGDLR